MKSARNPDNVHPPVAAYSHQIEITSPERLLVISGQVGIKADGTLPSDPIAQVDQALANIEANLTAAKMVMADVVKFTIYLVGEMSDPLRREAIAKHLRGHKPCMTLVYVAALASPEYRVEIEAWASASS